ncbi:MAG: hypothetical protein ACPGGB_08660, partial [Flavobacteriales bacterium]
MRHPMIPAPRPIPMALMLLAASLSLPIGAQTTDLNGGTTVSATDREDPGLYDRALHHFEHAQYTAALEGFDRFVNSPLRGDQSHGDVERLQRVEAEYRAS